MGDLSFLYLPDNFFFYIWERIFFIIIRVYMHWSYIFALCLLVNDLKLLVFDDYLWELLLLNAIF